VFGRRHVKSRRDLVRAEFGESMDHVRQAAAHAAGGLGATVGPRLGSAKDSAKDKTSSARGVVGPTAGRVSGAASRSWDSTIAAFAPLAEAARDGSARAAKLDAKNNKGNKGSKERKNSKGKEAASSMLITTKTTTKESTSHTGLYAILATGAAVGAAGALVARRRTRAKWAEYEPSSLNSDASSFLDAGATSTKSFSDKTNSEESDVTDHADAGAVTKAANTIKEHCKSAATTLRKKVHEATADPDGATGISDKIEDAGDKMNEGANHLADKAEAKLNAAKTPGGGSMTNTSGAAGRGEHMSDEVDDLIRSAKNGRM